MLTVARIKSLNKPGKHIDSNGLYLSISKSGSKSWIYRYQMHGIRREIGLGSFTYVSLRDARELAGDARKAQNSGQDPRTAIRIASPKNQNLTFDDCAKAYIKNHRDSWKNSKHVSQWQNTLDTYASPIIGTLPVNQINTDWVMRVLNPIWKSKTETASRVRGRIERVLSWAIVSGYHAGPNPALWRGHLDQLLPKRSKIQAVKHHASMPYHDVSEFMQQVKQRNSISAQALEFTILTAARTGEVLGAKWEEFDFEKKIWTIPAERMKAGREHRVPLSYQAIDLLNKLPRTGAYLFSVRKDKPLSNMTMLNLIKLSMDYPDLTVHGFRSTFRDWAAEVSDFPRELAESALAHVLVDKTEAAYQRGDLLEKRRLMMQAWADYLYKGKNVIQGEFSVDRKIAS
jgi:integrase